MSKITKKKNHSWIKKSAISAVGYWITVILVGIYSAFLLSKAGINVMELYDNPVFNPKLLTDMTMLMILPLVNGFIYAATYNFVRKGIPGEGLEKGIAYGFIIWVVGTIPGMLLTITTFAVPSILIVSWTFEALLSLVIGGVITAKLYGEK